MRPLVIVTALALSGLATLPALAESVSFQANLTAADEVPPHPDLKGAGHLDATLDTETGKLTYHVTYQGLTGPAIAAHFHGPAGPGQNAGVVVPVTVSASPIDGSATLTADQMKEIQAGQLYFNIHTALNKGGEIRGQVAKGM